MNHFTFNLSIKNHLIPKDYNFCPLALCRDFMDPTMDSTKHILNYLMPILEQVDTELHDFMIRYVWQTALK